jgi:hypothetical protein
LGTLVPKPKIVRVRKLLNDRWLEATNKVNYFDLKKSRRVER